MIIKYLNIRTNANFKLTDEYKKLIELLDKTSEDVLEGLEIYNRGRFTI